MALAEPPELDEETSEEDTTEEPENADGVSMNDEQQVMAVLGQLNQFASAGVGEGQALATVHDITAMMKFREKLMAVLMDGDPAVTKLDTALVSSYTVENVLVDMVTKKVVNTLSALVVNGDESMVVEPHESEHWHVPKNERAF